MRYKRIGYNINVMRQSACLVINPIRVNSFASLFNCMPVDRASDLMMGSIWLGLDFVLSVLLGDSGFHCRFSFAPVFQWCCFTP